MILHNTIFISPEFLAQSNIDTISNPAISYHFLNAANPLLELRLQPRTAANFVDKVVNKIKCQGEKLLVLLLTLLLILTLYTINHSQ